MHILILYQYYHNPDCASAARHYTFAREWARAHRVTVITTDAWYGKRITDKFSWAPDGVDVRMLPVAYDNRMSAAGRIRAFGSYAARAVGAGLRIDRPDIVFGSSTPLTAAWAAARVAGFRRVPWVFEVRDLWPDFPIQMGAVRYARMQRALLGMERRLYQRADHVVSLSSDMTQHIRALGVGEGHVSTVENGTDFDLIDATADDTLDRLRATHALEGKKVVLYAGSFGRANAIENLLETADQLSEREDVRFVFLGDGFHRDLLAERTGNNVILPDPSPRHEIFAWFGMADLSLVSFIDLPVLASNSPSKFFDSLGCGTPVIVTNPGWMKSFVESNRCGWYVPPDDAAGLAERIRSVLDTAELVEFGANAEAIARERFDRRRMADSVLTIMSSLV